RTMQQAPQYADVVGDVFDFLADRANACLQLGLPRDHIVIDPGFGFGKTVNQNLTLLRRLRDFRSLGCPVLMGTSRKSTIGAVLDLPAEERVEGTAATCACAIMNGADIIRVHDVKEMVRVARMTDAVARGFDGGDD
ncbi:MAG TPA: dihydropteroate synthase, partial [Armatimonadota bacterium]|nr:dihydropteroate synthase [Armatimonadota bacterium]